MRWRRPALGAGLLERFPRFTRHHQLALALSMAVHGGLYALMGVAGGAGGGQPQPKMVLQASLYQADATKQPKDSASRFAGPGKPSADVQHGAMPLPRKPFAEQRQNEKAPLIPVAMPVAPHYFPARELTQKPFVLRDIPSDIARYFYGVPPQKLALSLFISEEGKVDRVKIEGSDLPEDIERMVVQAFSEARFFPGKIGDHAVNSELKIEMAIEFAKDQAGNRASASVP